MSLKRLFRALAFALLCMVISAVLIGIAWLIAIKNIPVWVMILGIFVVLTFFMYLRMEDE